MLNSFRNHITLHTISPQPRVPYCGIYSHKSQKYDDKLIQPFSISCCKDDVEGFGQLVSVCGFLDNNSTTNYTYLTLSNSITTFHHKHSTENYYTSLTQFQLSEGLTEYINTRYQAIFGTMSPACPPDGYTADCYLTTSQVYMPMIREQDKLRRQNRLHLFVHRVPSIMLLFIAVFMLLFAIIDGDALLLLSSIPFFLITAIAVILSKRLARYLGRD